MLTYKVDQVKTVLPDDYSYLGIEEGRDLCTLVTCTPYGVNDHRLLVRGHRMPNTVQKKSESSGVPFGAYVLLVFGAVSVIAVFALILSRRMKRKPQDKSNREMSR